MHVADGAEIRDRNPLDRGVGQKKVADGHMDGVGELLKLLECRMCVAAFPIGKPREAVNECVEVVA
jgi:hypothetical protein